MHFEVRRFVFVLRRLVYEYPEWGTATLVVLRIRH